MLSFLSEVKCKKRKVLTWTTLQKEFSFRLLRSNFLSCSFDSSITYKKLQRKTFQNFVFSTVDKKKANHIKKDGTTPKNIFWGKKIHSYAWNVSLLGCSTIEDRVTSILCFTFFSLFFSREMQRSNQSWNMSRNKNFWLFSVVTLYTSKTRQKGTVIIMLWFYDRASCCCRWWFWPFNPHQHYFTVLTPPPGKNVCKSHKKIKCFMIWAHLFLQHFPRNFFGGSVYKNGDTLVWNQKMNGKSGGNETFLLTTDLLYE